MNCKGPSSDLRIKGGSLDFCICKSLLKERKLDSQNKSSWQAEPETHTRDKANWTPDERNHGQEVTRKLCLPG